ncbi:hypothetical protein HKD37_19G052944 [Glycine soja]
MAKESAQTLMDYLTFTLGKSNTIILLDLSEEVNFDFKHGFSQMLENNTFSGTHEAPIQNLKKFLKISNTVRQNCVLAEYVNLYAFIFSLNGRDRRNIKKGVHQIEKDESQTELGTQIQTLTLKIGSLMRAQAQMPINTPHFQTSEKCGIVHGPGECVVWVMH